MRRIHPHTHHLPFLLLLLSLTTHTTTPISFGALSRETITLDTEDKTHTPAPPPYTFDTKVRTLEILKQLRAGDLPLEVLDEHFHTHPPTHPHTHTEKEGGGGDESKSESGEAADVDFHLAMKGWDGGDYTCAAFANEANKKKEGEEEDEEGNSKSIATTTTTIKADPALVTENVLKVLDNTCALLNIDYWSYEWCHRQEVKQFHLTLPPGVEPTKEGGLPQNVEPIRDPEWSLGRYVRSETRYYPLEGEEVEQRGKKAKNGKKDNRNKEQKKEQQEKVVSSVVDYFEGGQLCHEIGDKGRKTAVEFYCCTSPKLPAEVKTRLEKMVPIPSAVAQLSSIKEISTCNYSMIVCSPLMCDSAHLDSLVTLEGAAANSQALRLLEPLSTYCLTRHEGYWSYEFCYKKGIRQYHQVAVRDEQGKTVSKVESEYVIGAIHSIPDDFVEEEHIVLAENAEQESGHTNGGDPTYFELEYKGGTTCDLTGEKRATTVQFVCGEGATDAFVSIKEDRSCHYKATIATPKLCKHPLFKKEVPTTHLIKCERKKER